AFYDVNLCRLVRCPSIDTLFPYSTLFRSMKGVGDVQQTLAILGVLVGASALCAIAVRFGPGHEAREPAPTSPRETAIEAPPKVRSEEHTSELQSREKLVCRLLLEKKKQDK